MAVALDLITDSLIELQIQAAGEPVDSDDSALALNRLNRMLDSWNTERLFIYVVEEDLYLLPAYQQQPTIGPSGTFIATRPVAIDAGNTIELVNTATNNPTGATATTDSNGTLLTDASQAFTTLAIPVRAGRDLVYIASGTGVTAGIYRISAVTATTITLATSAGANASAINYTVIVVPSRNALDTHRDFTFWAGLGVRGTTSTPTDLYYAPGLPNGTLNLYPASQYALALELFVRTQLTSIATINATLNFPPGYYEAVMYNLALRLANAFGQTPSQMLLDYASKSKAHIKALNSKAPRLTTDAPFCR